MPATTAPSLPFPLCQTGVWTEASTMDFLSTHSLLDSQFARSTARKKMVFTRMLGEALAP